MPPGWRNTFRMNAFLAACPELSTSAWPTLASFTHGEAVINTYGPAEIYKVPLMTAADYLWNPEQYDPQDALRRALYRLDPNPRVGPLVYRLTNGLHQRIFNARMRFVQEPTAAGLDEIKSLVGDYQRLFDRIKSETHNQMLVADIEPYIRRHVAALPILADGLAGFEKRKTDPDAGKQMLQQASAALMRLRASLERTNCAADAHACTRPDLERLNAEALHMLSIGAPASTTGAK